jgi:D-beta-D-heptose 7-phosphate kinase/D-beta-D-heptose 1-phosphate adenosyltransferase
MGKSTFSGARLQELLRAAASTRILVVGDVMLDQFIWGSVSRISPEAPVPVVDFTRESFMPGGAANVARNLSALGVRPQLFGLVGRDQAGETLARTLAAQNVNCAGLLTNASRPTTIKTRIVAGQQQIVRLDREIRTECDSHISRQLLKRLQIALGMADAVIVCDYGKGVVSQEFLDQLKSLCRTRGVWLSLDPKPVHHLNLAGLSLITPNRKEAFELAGLPDVPPVAQPPSPLEDSMLMQVANRLLNEIAPAVLLITLGDHGMLLCQRDQPPCHIPTAAREVFDVSGAGDTVIASFTLGIAAGSSPLEAAVLSNHAAGVVVGKIGTATVSLQELRASFDKSDPSYAGDALARTPGPKE